MWIYSFNGKKTGPVSFEEIVKLIQEGTISQQTVVCEIGQKPCRAGQNPKLQGYFSSRNIQTANSQPSAKQDVKSIPKPTTVPKTGAKTQKKSSFPIVPIAIAGCVCLILALVAGLFLVSGKKKNVDNPTPVASAEVNEPPKEEKEEPQEIDKSEEVDETEEVEEPKETPEEKEAREAKEKEEQEAREKKEKERKQREEEAKKAEEERKKKYEEIEAQNAKNRELAKAPGKVLVFTDDLRTQAKTADDYVPGFSNSEPDFYDYQFNFWTCVYSNKEMTEIGEYKPEIKRTLKGLHKQFNYQKVILSCTLECKNYSEINTNEQLADWIEFQAPYNKYKRKQSFRVEGYLPSNESISEIVPHWYLVQGGDVWIPTEEHRYKTVRCSRDEFEYAIKSGREIYVDDQYGVYSTIDFSVKTSPEIIRDIFNHHDDYVVEISTYLHYQEEYPITLYPAKLYVDNNEDISTIKWKSIPLTGTRKNDFSCKIQAIQIRNVKTNKIIAISNSDLSEALHTEVLDVNEVIAPHPNDEITNNYEEPVDPNDPNRFVQKINGVPFVYRWCPAGEFTMGSPEDEEDRAGIEKQHKVKLSKGFWILETEVTYAHFRAVIGKNLAISNDPKSRNDSGNDYRYMGAYPVENISWNTCIFFCKACKAKGMNVKLPTEAQWEYACRAGTDGPFASAIGQITCYADNSGGHACSVKNYCANSWKIYGMHGNVAEWCADWYGPYKLEDQTDPLGPSKGTKRIVRGGSWGSSRSHCRSAIRGSLEPYKKTPGLGFRLILLGHDKEE